MKRKYPSVSLSVQSKLHKAAKALEQVAPWLLLNESQLFAIQDPVSQQIAYCSILGQEGEMPGIALYRGREGLETLLNIQQSKQSPENYQFLGSYNALLLEFVPKKELSRRELLGYKKLDLYSQEDAIFPSFRSYVPGFQGWYCTEEECLFLLKAIECTLKHVADPSRYEAAEAGKFLLYTFEEETGWNGAWHTPGPIHKKPLPPVQLNPQQLEALKGVKLCRDTAWEASVFYTPSIICDKGRPYFARVCMIVHQETFLILQVKALESTESSHTFLASELLQSIALHKRIPSEIVLQDEELYTSLEPLSHSLGIELTLSKFLPATAPAQAGLLQYIR